MIPRVTPVVGGLLIDWLDFPEPDDHEFYEVRYGTITPPNTKYGETRSKQVTLTGLEAGTTYYVQIFAFDCFSSGQGSGIVSGVPLADTAVDGSGQGKQVGSLTLTTSPVDVTSFRATFTTGEIVYFWGCMAFTSSSAGSGELQVIRRVPGGGGNPPPVTLRTSHTQIPSSSTPVTGHCNGQDSPTTGDWEYVLQAYGSVAGMIGSEGYLDLLIKR